MNFGLSSVEGWRRSDYAIRPADPFVKRGVSECQQCRCLSSSVLVDGAIFSQVAGGYNSKTPKQANCFRGEPSRTLILKKNMASRSVSWNRIVQAAVLAQVAEKGDKTVLLWLCSLKLFMISNSSVHRRSLGCRVLCTTHPLNWSHCYREQVWCSKFSKSAIVPVCRLYQDLGTYSYPPLPASIREILWVRLSWSVSKVDGRRPDGPHNLNSVFEAFSTY